MCYQQKENTTVICEKDTYRNEHKRVEKWVNPITGTPSPVFTTNTKRGRDRVSVPASVSVCDVRPSSNLTHNSHCCVMTNKVV